MVKLSIYLNRRVLVHVMAVAKYDCFIGVMEICLILRTSSLPVLHHSADYIFIFFGIIWVQCGIFKTEILLMYTLEGESSVTNFIHHENTPI